MAIFDKKYFPSGKIAELEAYIVYLQERLDFYASKNDKKVRELEAEVAELKKQIKK
jgi:hypothetical protein